MTMKKKQFIILAAVAVSLLAVYLGVSIYSDWKAEKEAEKEAAELQVTDIDSQDIVKLSYTDGEESFSFTKEDDDTWYYDGDDQLPLDQSTVTNALDSYSDLSGTRKLKKADVDEEYGLDSPAYTIAMEDSEGNVTEINIGDMTGDEYYITADGGETVYTVASTITSYMVFDVNSLVQYETFPTIYETIFDKIVVTQGGVTLLDYDAESEEESEDSENDSDSSEDESSDEESLTEIYAGEVGSIYFDDCVDYRADEDELAQYGLDGSSRKEVTVTYEDTAEDETATVTFHMGDVTEEDGSTYVYIRLADSNMVYKVNADDMENLLSL